MRVSRFFQSLFVTAAAALSWSSAAAADMTGAGATFPYPIYAKWADMYKGQTGVGLNYQSIGSGGGIKQIKAKTVDFGASDRPLGVEELAVDGLLQFPAVMGGVVPIVHLEGVAPGQLKFTPKVLADIYLGSITKWNDPKIVALNAGVSLPNADITVIYRSDGSGTTFLWTDFLSGSVAVFKEKIGKGTSVKWPTGMGGKGNEGVAANVQRIRGSIGYVEYAYAKKNKLAHTQLQNKEGHFVTPSEASFRAAAAGADWAGTPGMGVVLTNQPGRESWPVTGASFILIHEKQASAERGKEVLKFFDWAYKNGNEAASELDYVAMPQSVVKQIQAVWKSRIKDASGKAIW